MILNLGSTWKMAQSSFNCLKANMTFNLGAKTVTYLSNETRTHAQWQVHYPREPFLMLLWQPISFDMTALETLTPQ